MDQDHYYYISRVAGMVQPIADAILATQIIPLLPSIDHICQGIDIAVNDLRRANLLTDPSLNLPRSPRTHGCHKVLDSTLVDPPMMDRILGSIITDVEKIGPIMHVWPAAIHRSLITPEPTFRFSKHPAVADLYLFPILFPHRWTLFLADPQRGVIEFLDFLYTSVGCDVRTFQVS